MFLNEFSIYLEWNLEPHRRFNRNWISYFQDIRYWQIEMFQHELSTFSSKEGSIFVQSTKLYQCDILSAVIQTLALELALGLHLASELALDLALAKFQRNALNSDALKSLFKSSQKMDLKGFAISKARREVWFSLLSIPCIFFLFSLSSTNYSWVRCNQKKKCQLINRFYLKNIFLYFYIHVFVIMLCVFVSDCSIELKMRSNSNSNHSNWAILRNLSTHWASRVNKPS